MSAAPAPAPEVSVVIPTHDRWALLQVAVASALSQEDVAVEVVVVDDGSSDPTAAGLAALDDRRVRHLRHDVARGPAPARNAGLAAARAPWVAFLDDDDWWSAGKLRRQLDAARAAGAAWAYASAALVAPGGALLGLAPAPPAGEVPLRIRARNLLPAPDSNVLVRTDVLRALGGFDETLWHFSDWELWIRLAQAEPAVAIEDVLVAYFQHPAVLRADGTAGLEEELAAIDARHGAPSPATAADRHDLLRWIADAHRAAGRPRRALALDLRLAVRYRAPRDVLRGLVGLAGPRAMARARALRRAGRTVATATATATTGTTTAPALHAPPVPPPLETLLARAPIHADALETV